MAYSEYSEGEQSFLSICSMYPRTKKDMLVSDEDSLFSSCDFRPQGLGVLSQASKLSVFKLKHSLSYSLSFTEKVASSF